MFDIIHKIMESIDVEGYRFINPTIVYNEGWIMRLALFWFYENRNKNIQHPLAFNPSSRWYSEALLSTPFKATRRGDRLAENYTHADGVIGEFEIGGKGKSDLIVKNDCMLLKVVESKLFSKLSENVTNAKYYNQAARSFSCILNILKEQTMNVEKMQDVSFIVIGSRKIIEKEQTFEKYLDREYLYKIIDRRLSEYSVDSNVRKEWEPYYHTYRDYLKIHLVSWEEIIEYIRIYDLDYSNKMSGFYKECCSHYPEKN